MMQIAPLANAQETEWLDKFDPRLRILIAVCFSLLISTLTNHLALIFSLLFSVFLLFCIRLPLKLIARRLLAFEGFILLIVIFFPFTIEGEVVWELGGFNASVEGLERALTVFLRANAIIISMLCLLGTLEPETLGHALARLGVPNKLAHLFLMTARYLDVLFDEYSRLKQAMRARAFVPKSNFHTWRTFGWLIGMLLVRSMDRSQRIMNAMKCRGFNGRLYLLDNKNWQVKDTSAFLVFSFFSLAILFVEHQI